MTAVRAIPCDFYNAAVSEWDGAAATVRQTAGHGIDGTGGVVVVRGFRAGSFAQFVPDEVSGTLDCEHMNGIGNGTPCLAVFMRNDDGNDAEGK